MLPSEKVIVLTPIGEFSGGWNIRYDRPVGDDEVPRRNSKKLTCRKNTLGKTFRTSVESHKSTVIRAMFAYHYKKRHKTVHYQLYNMIVQGRKLAMPSQAILFVL